MLEILQFIFSSFWVWLGTVILLCVITTTVISAIAGMFAGMRGDT